MYLPTMQASRTKLVRELSSMEEQLWPDLKISTYKEPSSREQNNNGDNERRKKSEVGTEIFIYFVHFVSQCGPRTT